MQTRPFILMAVLAAASATAPQESAAVVQLRRLLPRVSDRGRELDEALEKDLEQRIADVRMQALLDPAVRREGILALLDVAAAAPISPLAAELSASGADAQGTPAARLRACAFESLELLLRSEADGALETWLASHVLARADEDHPLRRQCAALFQVGRYAKAAQLSLFTAARDEPRALRDAAMAALAGWDDEGVHRFVLQQWRRARAEPGWISERAVRAHFALAHLPRGAGSALDLAASLRAALAGEDWRAIARTVELSRALDDFDAVPVLIEGLESWGRRRADGRGRLRVEGDLVGELQRRSRRNIGLFPERWRAWWQARAARAGDEGGGTDDGPSTSAGFFGLRPLTDRVVFVIDRSRSMSTEVGGGAATRYERAREELSNLLGALGPQARFRVVLFSDAALEWSTRLKPASESNLSAARAWIANQSPNGSTGLLAGVRTALELDARGVPDLARLEADTVIVLCDGGTDEGPGWVAPLMDSVAEATCVRIHCVLIGTAGDGTLEALAGATGGEFRRVDL